ncbi:MAG: hypothetical protein AAF514_21600, partial [Verrucomicrobiota bacterium]
RSQILLAVLALFAFSPSLFGGIAVEQKVDVNSGDPGDYMEFTIRYRCASLTAHCLNAKITATAPASTYVASYSQTGGLIASASQSGKTVTWTLQSPGSPDGQLDAGTTGLLKVRLRFNNCSSSTPPAGVYTHTVNFSADGESTAVSNLNVTMNSDIPPCSSSTPTEQVLRIRNELWYSQKTLPLGATVLFDNIDFPETGSTPYEVIADIPEGTIVSYADDWQDSSLNLEVECADTGTFYPMPDNWGTYNWEADPSSMPAPCRMIDLNPVTKAFNITRIKYKSLGDHVKNLDWGLSLHVPAANPFSSTDLPNYTQKVPGDNIVTCLVSPSNPSLSACDERDLIIEEPGMRLLLEKWVVGSPQRHWKGRPNYTPYSSQPPITAEDPAATPPVIQHSRDMVYRIDVHNYIHSTYNAVDPILTDLLPEGMDYDPSSNWWRVQVTAKNPVYPDSYLGDNPNCLAPSFSASPNWNGTGRTLLKWEFPGCTLHGVSGTADHLAVDYSATLVNPMISGDNIENRFAVSAGDLTNWILDRDQDGCYNSNEEDWEDHDGDGLTIAESEFCYSYTRGYTFPSIMDLQATKWVQGKLDSEFSRFPLFGDTDLSGNGTFVFEIKNTGTVPISQLEILDILLGVAAVLAAEVGIEARPAGVTWLGTTMRRLVVVGLSALAVI